jgi:hypothetical protein
MASGEIDITFGQKPYKLQASAGHFQHQIMGVINSGPLTPRGLAAVAISQNEIDLSWNASSGTGLLGYRIYRGGVQIAQQTGVTYADVGLSPATLYSYQVSAYGSNFETAKSPAVSATTFGSGAGAFNFYIALGGNDANPGTLAQPWAITSFNNSGNANNAKMAGKKVGIIAGTYNTSLLTSGHTGAGDYSWSILNIPAGTAANPTYIASCNASGVYTPRVAIINVDTLNNNNIMGGGGGQAGGGTSSYITVDGITINGNNIGGGGSNVIAHLLAFWGNFSITNASAASETGITVQNCEIYNVKTTTHAGGQNSALIWFEGCHHCLVQNNLLHDATSTDVTDMDHVHAVEEYGCHDNQFLNNTFYNCSTGIEDKQGCTGTVVAYNYFYNVGNFGGGQSAVFEGFDGYFGNPNTGPAPINYVLRHNIVDGCGPLHLADLNTSFIAQPLNIYNNTIYDTRSGATVGWQCYATAASLLTYYNNIYYSTVGTGGGAGKNGKLVTGAPSTLVTLDYNRYFQGSANYTNMWGDNTTAFNTLATWQTHTGTEAHSSTGDPVFSAPIVSGSGPNKFKLGGASPILAAGRTGGPMGAWDTGVTQIGCNFGPYLG